MNYVIGRKYRYPNHWQDFTLCNVRGFIFEFTCGHCCTDNVFADLIDCHTGIPNWQNNQLELFYHI